MADRAVGLLRDKEVLERISSASSEYSNRFSWEKSSREFLSFLEGVLE
jgi:hypothetical protein